MKKIFSKKTLKGIAITLLAFLLLIPILFFAVRNVVLQKAIKKVQASVAARTHLQLNIQNATFTGLSTVQLSGISLVPAGKDTLLTTDTVIVSVKLFPAIVGRIRLGELQVTNTLLYLRKDSLQTNFRGLLKPSKKTEKKNTDEDFGETTFERVKTLLRYLPDDVTAKNAVLKVKYNDSLRYITLENLEWKNKKFSAVIQPQEGFATAPWLAEGYFDKRDIKGEVTLKSKASEPVDLYFMGLLNSGLSFNKLQLKVNKLDYESKNLVFEAAGNIDSLRMYNARLSADTVRVNKTGGNLFMRVSRSFITVDSTTTVTVNGINLSTFVQYPVGKEKIYSLSVQMPSTPAQTFFNSLPAGMFNTFEGIKVKGNLAYRLDCKMDGAMPDSLTFESTLKKENFAIVNYGKENFARINGSFMHTVYEGGRPLRSFVVGPENPAFTPSDQISVHFKNAVLINEDPSFFYHRGFIPQSFREAIAEVYKAGFKFVRGGSTISMQLVKNVYLERRKTIARKAEEALIVWLIENNHISTKERMFEVYLNIIEMAPGVYGIGEASRFYFNKPPANLTLAEGIYLSNIIPRPKAFKYGFEKDGTLKNWLVDKTNLVINRMVQREWLPASDTLGFNPRVQVTGPAKNFIIPADTIVMDTIPESNELFEE